MLCITRHKPWWRLYNIGTVRSELKTEVLEGTGAYGGGTEGTGARERAGVEEEGAEESSPLVLVLRAPRIVIVGLSRFQQFFFMYDKLMAGLRDSKVSESETTPLDMQSAVMRARKPVERSWTGPSVKSGLR